MTPLSVLSPNACFLLLMEILPTSSPVTPALQLCVSFCCLLVAEPCLLPLRHGGASSPRCLSRKTTFSCWLGALVGVGRNSRAVAAIPLVTRAGSHGAARRSPRWLFPLCSHGVGQSEQPAAAPRSSVDEGRDQEEHVQCCVWCPAAPHSPAPCTSGMRCCCLLWVSRRGPRSNQPAAVSPRQFGARTAAASLWHPAGGQGRAKSRPEPSAAPLQAVPCPTDPSSRHEHGHRGRELAALLC